MNIITNPRVARTRGLSLYVFCLIFFRLFLLLFLFISSFSHIYKIVKSNKCLFRGDILFHWTDEFINSNTTSITHREENVTSLIYKNKYALKKGCEGSPK